MDVDEMRRETERLNAESNLAIARQHHARMNRTARQEMWEEVKHPLFMLGLILFVVFPVILLVALAMLKFLTWLKATHWL